VTAQPFESGYRLGYPATIRLLVSRGVTGDLAQEVAQAAWAKGWERRSDLRDPEKLSTWVNSIALNLLRNWMRREKRSEALPDSPGPGPSGVPQPSLFDMRRGLSHCRPADRLLLWRRYVEGYSTSELAELLDCKTGALRVRLLRARRRAQTSMEGRPAAPTDAKYSAHPSNR